MIEFPSHWTNCQLGERIRFEYGKSPNEVRCSDGKYPVYGSSGKTALAINYTTESPAIIVGRKGTIDKPIFLQERCWAIDTTFFADKFPSDDPKYLFFLLDSINLRSLNESTGVPSLSRDALHSIPVSLPPLPEQKKIAEILSGIDRVIYSTSTARDRLFLLKKSLCLKLLATESKQCRQSKFSDVCIKIQDGTHFSPQSKDGNCLYITSKNIRPGRLDLSSINWISTEEHNTIYKRCQVQKGDILLTKDGANTGNACLNTLEEEFSLLSSVAFLRPNPSYCDANYMLQWIMSVAFQNEIQQEMSGNAISRLTLTKINNLSISLPPLEKQKEIAETLLSIDNQCKSYESKIDSFQMLKQAISADLLSGRKRVSI